MEKCKFYKKKVIFLGFLIRKEDIKMDSLKIEKILDWPQSKNLKENKNFQDSETSTADLSKITH